MSAPAPRPTGGASRLLELAAEALVGVDALLADAIAALKQRIAPHGTLSPEALETHQHAAHALSWLATYVEAVRQGVSYANRLAAEGRFGVGEELLTSVALAEYLAQIFGGIPMSQSEVARLQALGLAKQQIDRRQTAAVAELIAFGTSPGTRARLIEQIAAADPQDIFGESGLEPTLETMRSEVRRFVNARVAPRAQGWHLANEYVPIEVIREMADLGVFGLTIPEQFGGLGLGKESMCVVSEELSRGWIAVGSIGTRSEIAADLILQNGTEGQKRKWLPAIASGEVLPTAVFTEPDVGSDLAAIRTRATREGGVYRVYGNKSWITHPVRADLMTLLVRTDPRERGYRGLSMLLAEKPRGTDADPFPAAGMSGTEIEVLGYRGMKEFEIAFDGFVVPVENLLGGEEGQGFKQLMQTFETARIQTAARAVGVAQSAMDLGLRYARERIQFGKPILSFPRVADKIAFMAADIMMARQLTYFAAREKDRGRRCDIEAGMAKLLAARVAWSAADNAVQIHGGSGFALESPVSRILCDARILSIFEGAAEIQAQVIARRLIEGAN